MPVRRPVCLICFIFLFIIMIATGGGAAKPAWDVDAALGRTVTVSGCICDRQEHDGTLWIFLKDISYKTDQAYFPVKSKGILVKTADKGQAGQMIRMGAHIEARGVFEPFELPRCEGMFDSRSYYMIRGYEGQLKKARITGVSKGYDHVTEALRTVRERAEKILEDSMSKEDASLVAAMTLGDKSGLDSDIKELYQRAGISHILALSGLHIASAGLAVLAFMKKAGIRERTACVVSFFLIAVYAVMTGMSTSTQRAVIMFGLFVLSKLTGRTYDLLSGAAISALVILVFNPYYIYDPGFLLSFGAVLGIACIYPVFEKIPEVIGGKTENTENPENPNNTKNPDKTLLLKIYRSMCVSVSVMIATFPVMGNSFMQVSVYSVVINLIVIPLMGLVLFTGSAGILTGFCGLDPRPLLWITHYILLIFERLGSFFEKISGNIFIIGKPEQWQIITYAIITITAVITWNFGFGKIYLITHTHKSIDRTGRCIGRNIASYFKNPENKITYSIKNSFDRIWDRRKKIGISIITIVMIFSGVPVLAFQPRKDLEIRNIDVGQGDSALIFGDGTPVIMIDGGSSDIRQVAKNRIEPVLKANSVAVIDYWFLTHMDSDHVNGVFEMLADKGCGIRVRNIVVSASSVEGVQKNMSDTSVSILVMNAGDEMCFRAKRDKNLRITCLNPGHALPGADENENSLVLCFEYDGFRALFTGDIGEVTEEEILPLVDECTYLKVAHHGSRYSSSPRFLQKVTPKIAVISAGVDNSYGHPHPETTKRLQKVCRHIYSTKSLGEIILALDDGILTVRFLLDDRQGSFLRTDGI